MPYNRSELHRKGPWIYCSTCDAPGDRILEEEDAAIARQRPFRILPVPNAKPFVLLSPYAWEAEEGQVFDFVLQTAPVRNPGGASSVDAAAWGMGYLADIVNENKRPAVWISSAKTKIASLAAFLISQQNLAVSVQDPRYGGFNVTSTYTTGTTIAAGLAFVKAYQALGTQTYLVSAKACATFLRHAQCGDVQVTKHTVYPAAGSPYHVGGFSAAVDSATQLQSGSFSLNDVNGAVFLVALSSVVGLSATFGDAASTSFFTASTQATLSTMIAEVVAFAETGPKDSAHADAPTPGLSTTAPKASYTAYLSDSTGTGTWGAPSTVASSTIARGLAGIYAANSADPLAASLVAWLLAFTANAANATPTTNTPQQTLNAITGTYDPTIAPATFLQASAPFTDAAGALYDLAALGLMATPLAGLSAATLRNGRSTLSVGEPYSTFYLDLRYPGILGRAGLALQPNSAQNGVHTPDVVFASQFGAVFRVVNP